MVVSSTLAKHLDDFVLNSGPKQDCLLHICQYINVFDMANIIESSKHSETFVEFFKDFIIHFNSFDFMEVPTKPKVKSLEAVFEYFGPCMQKIKVSFSSVPFQKFIQLVVQYCVPGRLIELEMEVHLITTDGFKIEANDGRLEQIRPILHGLENLSLSNTYGKLNPIFELYRQDLPNLKSLSLKNFRYDGGWADFLPTKFTYLTELYLICVNIHEDAETFKIFLDQFVDLQVFVHLRHSANRPTPEVITDCLYERFPKLRGFGCNVGDSSREIGFAMNNRFSFLRKFTDLTEFHVGSYDYTPRDIHGLFQYIPNIKTFSIAEVTLFQPPVAIRRIRRTIKELINGRRDRFPPNDRVHIIVNIQQYRDFQTLKNVNEIIKLTISPVWFG